MIEAVKDNPTIDCSYSEPDHVAIALFVKVLDVDLSTMASFITSLFWNG